ncbi:lipoyl(octanoyl) transferase LipB [Bdellovibrionota bacterium FG-1]
MQFRSLKNLTSYAAARELQLELVEQRAQDQIPDTVLFLEHEPVITRGRGLQFTGTPRPRHMPLPVSLPPEIAFSESERGGDLTYHGPGQLVIYPIIKLEDEKRDIGAFLRGFEEAVMAAIAPLSGGRWVAESRPHATGVWIGDRKLASMGIAVRRWVTYHGLAINCVNDLAPFHLISPCGFSPEVMTRLVDWLDPESKEFEVLSDWQARGRADLEARIGAQMGWLRVT